MSNEAAERLRDLIYGEWSGEHKELVDEALAAERKATVERIRGALIAPTDYEQGDLDPALVTAILDAEAER